MASGDSERDVRALFEVGLRETYRLMRGSRFQGLVEALVTPGPPGEWLAVLLERDGEAWVSQEVVPLELHAFPFGEIRYVILTDMPPLEKR